MIILDLDGNGKNPRQIGMYKLLQILGKGIENGQSIAIRLSSLIKNNVHHLIQQFQTILSSELAHWTDKFNDIRVVLLLGVVQFQDFCWGLVGGDVWATDALGGEFAPLVAGLIRDDIHEIC